MQTLVDSHVHLDDSRFDSDRDLVVARAHAAGVDMQIVPGTTFCGWPGIRDLSLRHAGVFPAYGLHPMFLADHRPEHLVALPAWLSDGQAVAVGEIGLDFHVEGLDHDEQRRYFTGQLALARELDLPVIIHARRALEEVTLTLRREGGLRGVVHSFSGSPEQARQLIDLGFLLGIGGPVTYPRAQRLRGWVARMPLDHLLLESDAPDQPAANHRGQRNEPAHITSVLACIAELRQQPETDVAAATTENARRLFGLDRPDPH